METYSQQIAEFATTLKLVDVPPEVVARAKLIILDGLGCGLFGANLEPTRILASVIGKLEPDGGRCTVWGRNEKASAIHAALVNGTQVQGFELDDANPASIHSCAAVLPAALAAAEHVGAGQVDGERLLTAIIAGFEIGPRVGLCMNGNKILVKGWHAPGVFGVFPAAVAAGVVLGLTKEQMAHAIGIVAPLAGGLLATQFGSMVKRMLSARSSQSGVYSALLAAEGFTGIVKAFEEPYGGYCTTFTQSQNDFDLTALTADLGTRWETMRISIKRHATVGTNLSSLDAIEEMMAEGLKAEDVDKVTVRMTQDGVHHSYWTPYEPTGLTAAQMHIGFCIATKLIEGEVFVDQMKQSNIGRPDLMALCERVTAVRDPEREAKGRPFARGATVEVLKKDGTMMTRTIDNFLGSLQRPMSSGQMAQKFRRLAATALDERKVTELEQFVQALDSKSDTIGLFTLLAGR